MDYFCRECGFKFNGRFCPRCGESLDHTLVNSLENSLAEEYYEPKQANTIEGFWTKPNRNAAIFLVALVMPVILWGSRQESYGPISVLFIFAVCIFFAWVLNLYFKWKRKCQEYEIHTKTLIYRMREAGKYANAYAMQVNEYYPILTENIPEPEPKQKTVEEELEKIDRMTDGFSFEQYVGDLLRKMGYQKIDVTRGSGDYGADVIAEKDGKKYAVQCKCFSKNNSVGYDAAKEAVAGASFYKCDAAIVITNQYFTNNIKTFAENSNIPVSLWDRNALILILENVGYVHKDSRSSVSVVANPASLSQAVVHKSVVPVPDKEIPTQNAEEKDRIDLTAGIYVFGEDLPSGKYDLRVHDSFGQVKLFDQYGEEVFSEYFTTSNHGLDEYKNLYCGDGYSIEIQCRRLCISKSKHEFYKL